MEKIEAEIELQAGINTEDTEDIEWLEKLIYSDPVKDFLLCVERLQKVDMRIRWSRATVPRQKKIRLLLKTLTRAKLEWQISPARH